MSPPSASRVDDDSLPAYTATSKETVTEETVQHLQQQLQEDINLSAAFSNLDIAADSSSAEPTTALCLAHLKFLHTLQALKDDIGYTDGIFGLWDSRAVTGLDAIFANEKLPAEKQKEEKPLIDTEKAKLALSRVREKRWALYVARAVDRYAAWWKTQPIWMLDSAEMTKHVSGRFEGFPNGSGLQWNADMLPPIGQFFLIFCLSFLLTFSFLLDVLMVWHTHCLNPRNYLEDCVRYGLSDLWQGGFPWKVVNDAIDTNFDFNAPETAKTDWANKTGRSWLNEEDSLSKKLDCPHCKKEQLVPWTTTNGSLEKDVGNE